MNKHKKICRLTGIFCLLAVMLLNISVYAMESGNNASTEARQEDLNFLYENLKSYHPDIYANTPEDSFLAQKAKIESRLSSESDADFILDLQSMTALIRDSHTKLSIGSIVDKTGYYPMNLAWFDGAWVLSLIEESHQDLLGAQVTAINDLSMEQVLERFSNFISADNPIKLRRQYRQSCYVEELYRYAGIIGDDGALNLTLRDITGKTRTLTLTAVKDADHLKQLSLSSLGQQRKGTSDTDYNKNKYYFAEKLDSNTYYIQYNQCAEDPDLPMKTFCTQVKNELDTGNYQQVMVDLRNNGGGSDGVIYPLLQLLRQEIDQKGLEVITLIGETTFSSGIINAVELQEMGSILAGEDTSGSVNHFGSVGGFQLPNSGIQVQVSSKFISLSSLFDAAAGKGVEALTPDVEIPQTLNDYLAGRDTCVEKLISDPACLKFAERDSAPLTRSRFIGMLYKDAGSPKQTINKLPFSDLLGIEWYLPALNWAVEENVAEGTGSNMFSGIQDLTWQEAAVFLVRSVKAMYLKPTEVTDSLPPEILLTGAWDKIAIEQAWKWGLLPQDADFTNPPTRKQGEAMADTLKKINYDLR